MKFFLTAILAFALLVLSAPTVGASGAWVDIPGGATKVPECDVKDFRACWWDALQATAATHVTGQIDVTDCENITYSLISNIADTAHNNTVAAYDNQAKTIDASDITAEKIQNADLNGDPAASLYSVYGADATFVYFRFTFVDASSTARLKLHCHPRH